ncbi:hypothetical protein BKA61DRAFT_576192 [Leptodontidium sp. MPI-SDFR-AT-0119]|nr:hypothetical protein BKA61DRAFT_576192 [Leptodontidium sp. MPI-SDFR-AT-0119]
MSLPFHPSTLISNLINPFIELHSGHLQSEASARAIVCLHRNPCFPASTLLRESLSNFPKNVQIVSSLPSANPSYSRSLAVPPSPSNLEHLRSRPLNTTPSYALEMPRENWKKGPKCTSKKDKTKTDYTPNVNPHPKNPIKADFNKGRRNRGAERAAKAKSKAIVEAETETDKFGRASEGVRAREDDTMSEHRENARHLLRDTSQGAPAARQIPLPQSGQVSSRRPEANLTPLGLGRRLSSLSCSTPLFSRRETLFHFQIPAVDGEHVGGQRRFLQTIPRTRRQGVKVSLRSHTLL